MIYRAVYLTKGVWKLADKRGTFYKDEGFSISFSTKQEALRYAKDHKLDVED